MPVLSDAPYFLPLETTLLLQNGSGNPLFERSTIQTVFDNEDKLLTLPPGAIRFDGARIVRNLIGNSFNIVSGLSRTNVNLTPTADPVGGTAAVLFESTSTSNHNLNVNVAIDTNLTTSKRTLSLYFQPGSHDWFRFMFYNGSSAQARIWFNAQTKAIGISEGVNGFTLHQSKIYASTDYPGWWRVELTGSSPTSGAGYWQISAQVANGSTTLAIGATIKIYAPQMEPVLGQSDPSASEYIATGILSSPYYGAGVDGIKYFSTNKDGSAISSSVLKGLKMRSSAVTNTLLYCRDFTNSQAWYSSGYGPELVANGTFDADISGWSATGTGVVTWSSGALSLQLVASSDSSATAISCVIGQRYVVYGTVQAGTGSARILVGTSPGGSQISLFGQPTAGAAQTFSNTFIATATTHYISVGCTAVTTRLFDNITVRLAGVSTELTQTGIDGRANSCSLLTAKADGAMISQTITAASSAGCSGFYVKRSVGSGNVYFTRDNFVTLLDITAQIDSGTFYLAKIENDSVLNPTIGFKFDSPGDEIAVDYGINHLGTEIADPIFTTSAAVTVNAETLTYQLSGNFSDTAGTIIATVERANWANNNGVVVGKAGSGLATSASNSGVQALDGTNTANGPAGSTITRRKIGMKWSGSTMKTFAGGNFGSAGSYDGSFNLTTIAIMPQSNGYISDVAIWPTELSDADMLAVASEQSDFSAALSFAYSAYVNVIHSVSAAMPLSFGVTGYTSVIHSVSSDMDIDFNAAVQANVIHSVSADMGIIFDVDFDSTWIVPSLKIAGSYDPPIIQGTYGPTT